MSKGRCGQALFGFFREERMGLYAGTGRVRQGVRLRQRNPITSARIFFQTLRHFLRLFG